MKIRQAIPEDNEELQKLQARCPQGTSLIVSTVNTPDFFARVKAYETYRVFVACDPHRILGSGACALRKGRVDGNIDILGYEFQYFISPDSRRKGVAKQLRRHIENYLIQQGASLSYALVMEGNVPSMRLLESDGFKRHRRLVMRTLPIWKEKQVPPGSKIRTARDSDLMAVSRLINDTWRNHELFEPTSMDSLKHFIDRIPAFTPEDLLLLENQYGICACLGCWDWSQVMRVTVKKLSCKMRWMGRLLVMTGILPKFIQPGDTMKQVMLTLIGFKDPSDLSVLLRHLNNLVLRKGIEQIFCICEQGNRMLKSTKGFIHVDTTLQMYVKHLGQRSQLSPAPVFVDGIDV